MNREVYIVFLLVSIIITLFFAKTYFEDDLATQGGKVYQLQQQVKKIELDNAELKIELYQNMSYNVIATKAAAMGFRPIQDKDILYLR